MIGANGHISRGHKHEGSLQGASCFFIGLMISQWGIASQMVIIFYGIWPKTCEKISTHAHCIKVFQSFGERKGVNF